MIGGNINATFQVKDEGTKNSLGERIHKWVDVAAAKGFLDLSNSNTSNSTFNAKIQESTHIFMCDWQSFKGLSSGWVWNPFSFVKGVISTDTLENSVDVTSENARIVIDGLIYNITLIDDPMNLHQHLEIYLKFTGGQHG